MLNRLTPVRSRWMYLSMLNFEGSINVLGVNTVYEDTKKLLSCFATRGNGSTPDSNRNDGRQLVRLIRNTSQLGYNISRIIDLEMLAEGKNFRTTQPKYRRYDRTGVE